MKIQKGLVKYKDRSDIVCTYAITDDGKQFYFLNDSKLSNDNIIVTTSLVEAIDPSVVCSNIGVINSNGEVVIECNNKSIKLITKDILLVEVSKPTSPSVVESIQLKKDPLAATNLVSTPAVIKDKIYNLMGMDGRFLFNDQFSEASLCDLNGNNLLDNKFYSFISINKKGDTIYLCGNTKESVVDTFSLVTMKFNDTTNVVSNTEVPAATEEPVDVAEAEVSKEEIDNAMETSVENQEVAATEVSVEDVAPAEVPVENQEVVAEEATPEVPAENIPAEEVVPPEVPAEDIAPAEVSVENQEVVSEEVVEAAPEVPAENIPAEEVVPPEVPAEDIAPAEVPVENQEVVSEDMPTPEVPEVPMGVDIVPPVEEPVPVVDNGEMPQEGVNVVPPVEEPAPVVENTELPVENSDMVPSVESEPVEDVMAKVDEAVSSEEPVPEENGDAATDIQSILDIVTNKQVDDLPVVEDNSTEEVQNEVVSSEEAMDEIQKIEETPIPEVNNYSNNSFENVYNNYDNRNILDEIDNDNMFGRSNTDRYGSEGIMNDAAKTLSKLISVNKSQRAEINTYKDQVKELTSLNKKVVDKARHDRDRMKDSISNYESEIDRLKAQLDNLENRMHERERVISNQNSELSNLRVQLEGKNNLQKILQDAESILGNNNY